MKLKLRDIARILGGNILSPGAADIDIVGVEKIDRAGPGQIAFAPAPQQESCLASTRAAAVVVARRGEGERSGLGRTTRAAVLEVEDPYRALMRLVSTFEVREDAGGGGIHPTAIVPESAIVHPEAELGPYVVLGENVVVGPRTRIGPQVFVGSGVVIGADCVIHAGVTLREASWLGDRVVLHGGAVIGADGFGYLPDAEGRREKVPQIGQVWIEDDVEIGANSTIDRATIDRTIIRRGARIENLVQVAHNVEVGEDSCIGSQAGIAGSSRIGARTLIASQAGIIDHVEIGDDVVLLPRTAVIGSVSGPGIYAGAPARELGARQRIENALERLPETTHRLRDLEQRVAAVEQRSAECGVRSAE